MEIGWFWLEAEETEVHVCKEKGKKFEMIGAEKATALQQYKYLKRERFDAQCSDLREMRWST